MSMFGGGGSSASSIGNITPGRAIAPPSWLGTAENTAADATSASQAALSGRLSTLYTGGMGVAPSAMRTFRPSAGGGF